MSSTSSASFPMPSSPPEGGIKRSHDDMGDNNNAKPERQGASPLDPKSTSGSRTPVPEDQNLRPPSGQQPKSDGPEEEEDVDPSEKIEDLDWDELMARYHRAMDERSKVEISLYDEFKDLVQFFDVWANATVHHETERTYKRLKTRVAHVEHSEEKLEATRQHYIQVVKAFESAMALLRSSPSEEPPLIQKSVQRQTTVSLSPSRTKIRIRIKTVKTRRVVRETSPVSDVHSKRCTIL